MQVKDQFLEHGLYISALKHVMKLIPSNYNLPSINEYNVSMLSRLSKIVKCRSIIFWSVVSSFLHSNFLDVAKYRQSIIFRSVGVSAWEHTRKLISVCLMLHVSINTVFS